MGYATLNVWIHDSVDPCHISNQTWSVTVFYCDGKTPVNYCDPVTFPFTNPVQAPCGHVEITLPPGCYVVSATLAGSPTTFQPPVVNTEHGIVVAGCDEKACVHLGVFPPPSTAGTGNPPGR